MKRIAIAAALSAALLPASARAQDASIVEGPGVLVGEGSVLHPIIGADVGMISNVFFEDQAPVTSSILRIHGELDFASAGSARTKDEGEAENPAAPQKLQFRAGLKARYDEYLSGGEAARAQRNLGLDANVHLRAFPEGKVTFRLDDRFIRDTRPLNQENTGNLNRLVNDFAIGVDFQPGERAIKAGLGYRNRLDIFESSESRFADRIQHQLEARAEWKWLPITKFLFDASYGFFSQLGGETLNGTAFKQSSNPLRAKFGVATALTEMTTLRASAGWAWSPYAAGQGFNAPTFGAEFGYRYSPMGRVAVSYSYDFVDSINSNFYRDHALLARIDQQVRMIVVEGRGGLRLRGYRGVPMALGAANRDDFIVEAQLGARYHFRDWLAATADYLLQVDQTDFRTTFAGQPDDPSYTRHEVTAGVRAAF